MYKHCTYIDTYIHNDDEMIKLPTLVCAEKLEN